ncbi:MAG: ATP-binding protein [Gemmatimonadales bacterium]|nr:ATP-binding protein [Gemmatimonadales bacterium]
MRISRLTIDKLGVKLYDKVAAVLAELVANCYDADATTVRITLPFDTYLAIQREGVWIDQGHEIVIEDNGHGMMADEVNRHYLHVGINRRTTRGQQTPHGRQVMGRKGIGKLAPFGICHEIEVVTAGGARGPQGFRVSNLILRYEDMLTEDEEPYNPIVGPLDDTFLPETGTRITLRRFDRRRVPDGPALNRQLAARFGLVRPDWRVQVVDSVAAGDTFVIGDLPIQKLEGTEIRLEDRPVPMPNGGPVLPVRGWVAYASVPYKDEAMAGIRIFARGKLVAQTRDFDIQSGFTGEYKMRSYLVGEVHADWLDEGDEDLVRSDRQDILWNSEKGEALRDWGQALIRALAGQAETSLRGRVWDDFLETSQLERRVQEAAPDDPAFRDSVVRAAKLLVGRNDREAVKDADYAQRVVDFAFAVGPQRTLLSALHQAADEAGTTLDIVLDLFHQAGVAETYSLGVVAQERVDAVGHLETMIRTNETQEAKLQVLVEGAPWILHPEWTPLSRNESLNTFRRAFEAWYRQRYGRDIVTSAIEHPARRPDFVFVQDEGFLEIVEIKHPGHALTDDEMDRAYGYLQALQQFLAESPDVARGVGRPRLVIICDATTFTRPSSTGASRDADVSLRAWAGVLHATMHAHEDFLAAVRGRRITPPPLGGLGEDA